MKFDPRRREAAKLLGGQGSYSPDFTSFLLLLFPLFTHFDNLQYIG